LDTDIFAGTQISLVRVMNMMVADLMQLVCQGFQEYLAQALEHTDTKVAMVQLKLHFTREH
jgi:hypothetical protein